YYVCVTARNDDGETDADAVELEIDTSMPARVDTALVGITSSMDTYKNKIYFYKGKDASWSTGTAMDINASIEAVSIADMTYESSSSIQILATQALGACCTSL